MIDQIRESRERLGSRNRETKAITLEVSVKGYA